MARRPNRLLRWSYGSSATLVEPSSGKAETGYATGERPPAGWMNTHLHLAGAWIGYLRGPNLGNWTRAAHGVLTAFDDTAGVPDVQGIAADEVTEDGATACRRYAILGLVSAASAIRVSRRGIGDGWAARAIPASVTGTLQGIAFVGRWLTWSATANELWSTIADDLSGNSAIGTNDATKWASVTATSITVKAAAWCAGVTGRAAGARHAVVFGDLTGITAGMLYSTDSGATWTSTSYAWAGTNPTTDGTYDATRDRFVMVGTAGAVAASVAGAPGSAWAAAGSFGALISSAGIGPNLANHIVAGGGTILAWAVTDSGGTPLASTFMVRSTDGGATWSQISAPDDITHVAYADGAWIASCSAAPYLYESHDDGDSWQRTALPVGEEAAWALARVVYADGQVLATGVDFCVASGRAMATEDGTLVPDTTPSILSDAYRLRGRLIYDTAPSDGDVYSWNAATSRWEPVAASSLSVTTTRGDLIVRGAGADQRLAVGTAARYLRSDGTDPSWQQVAAADVTGLPWWGVVSPDEIATSDATVTTLATIAAATDHLFTVDVLVSAREAARTFSVAWKLLATVSSDGAAATVEDVLITGPTDGGASGCSVAIDTSGTDIRVRVTGLGGTSITWGVQGTVQRIGS
jgi:hypothetical protein